MMHGFHGNRGKRFGGSLTFGAFPEGLFLVVCFHGRFVPPRRRSFPDHPVRDSQPTFHHAVFRRRGSEKEVKLQQPVRRALASLERKPHWKEKRAASGEKATREGMRMISWDQARDMAFIA